MDALLLARRVRPPLGGLHSAVMDFQEATTGAVATACDFEPRDSAVATPVCATEFGREKPPC